LAEKALQSAQANGEKSAEPLASFLLGVIQSRINPEPGGRSQKLIRKGIDISGELGSKVYLAMAAQVIPRIKESKLNVFFRKRIIRAGYRKAIVATAHKILQYAYYVLKNQMPYSEEYPVSA